MKRTIFIALLFCMLLVGVVFSPIISYSYNNEVVIKNEKKDSSFTRGAPLMNEEIWISNQEIQELPMEGDAWEALKAQADSPCGTPNISDQYQDNNVYVLAKALVYARTQNESYRQEVRDQLALAIDTELGGRTLALGRELAAYVISADLIDLPNYDPAFDSVQFCPWLKRCLTEELDGRTLRSTNDERPNNWGTHAGASRIAVAVYLQNITELDAAAQVFEGYLGDTSVYAGFSYGELSWQADSANPVGINPKGSMKEGYLIDGCIPDDMRRGGEFGYPPNMTNYPWEGLQGATVQAQLLYRQGYDAWNWSDRAILRAVEFLYDLGQDYDPLWYAYGDDEWNVWLINYAYGTDFPTELPARSGKNMGWTDWTHANSSVAPPKDTYSPLTLKPGWNLISIPLIQTDITLTKVLESIDGYYDAIQWYDPTDVNDHWKHMQVDKTFGNELTEIDEKMGFWIHISHPDGVQYQFLGNEPLMNQNIPIHPGWNLIGYPSFANHNRTQGLNDLVFGTDIDLIQWFNTETRTWIFMNPEDIFEPGLGYWMHSKVETTWEVPV